MATAEDWELGSGLALDGATAEITGARFTIDNNYSAEAVVLELTFTDEESGETQAQLYSVGKNWEIGDKGNTITGGKKVNATSGYGRWIHSAVEADMGDLLIGRGTPREADIWLGLKVVLTSIEFETMNPTTKEKKNRSMIVIESLAEGSTTETVAVAAKGKGKAAESTAKGAAKGKGKAADEEVPEELLKALRKLAAKTVANDGDHGAFVDAALDIDGVPENRAAMRAAQDKGADSIWSSAGGE